jgi:hypothetical protein
MRTKSKLWIGISLWKGHFNWVLPNSDAENNRNPPRNRLIQLIEREEDRNTSVFRGEKSAHVLV